MFGVSPVVLREGLRGVSDRTKTIVFFWFAALTFFVVLGLAMGASGWLLFMTGVVVLFAAGVEVGKEMYNNIKNRPQPREQSAGAATADLAVDACILGLPLPIDPKAGVPMEEAGAAVDAAAQAIDGELVEGAAEAAGEVAAEIVSGIVGSVTE